MQEPSGRSCVFDGDGRLIEVDGAPPGATLAEDLSRLLPGIDWITLTHCCAALDARPDTVLRLDVVDCGMPVTLVLSRGDRSIRCYRAVWGLMAGPGYRDRLEQRLAFERLIAALSTELIHAPVEQLDILIEQALGRIGFLFDVDRAGSTPLMRTLPRRPTMGKEECHVQAKNVQR